MVCNESEVGSDEKVGWWIPKSLSGVRTAEPARCEPHEFRETRLNDKESDIDMPEPQAERFTDFPNSDLTKSDDFGQILTRKFEAARIDPDGRHGRLVLVQSHATRRLLRRFASARESVTDADLLFVALAFLPDDPGAILRPGSVRENPQQAARLSRTLVDRPEAQRWTTIQASRLLALVDETVRSIGGSADWILEGVDWGRIAEILAVPADHRACGMIAVSGTGSDLRSEKPGTHGIVPIDRDGFGGSFDRIEPDTGEAPGRAL